MFRKSILAVLMLMFLFSATFPEAAVAAETKLYVDPPKTTGLDIGETFAVNISVADVTNLAGWHFWLYYESAVLDATLTYNPENGNYTQVLEGPFLKAGGETIFAVHEFTDNYNATHGRIIAFCALLGASSTPQSGGGTLATISFTAEAIGNSLLHIGFAELTNQKLQMIDHIVVDGSAHVGLYDIAVTDVTPSKTVANDTTLDIDVTVENQGETAVTSDVTLYITGQSPQTQTVTDLPGGEITILVYTWDTTQVPLGIYSLTAEAPLQGDVDPDDNTYPSAGNIITVTETIKGDIDGKKWESPPPPHYTVDIYDIVLVARAFGTKPGDQEWNPNADMVVDNIIDIYDVVIVAGAFGNSA